MSLHRITAALLPALLAACASPFAPTEPSALRPAGGERLLMTVAARGVQIYECRSTAGAAPAWTLLAPEAELFDAAGRAIGTHGAGPHWAHRDGSRVVASVAARADAPVAGAIPWLLLAARPDNADRGTPGVLAGITHIQRVDTAGGTAPAGTCQSADQPLRMPYVAAYHFYRSPQ